MEKKCIFYAVKYGSFDPRPSKQSKQCLLLFENMCPEINSIVYDRQLLKIITLKVTKSSRLVFSFVFSSLDLWAKMLAGSKNMKIRFV